MAVTVQASLIDIPIFRLRGEFWYKTWCRCAKTVLIYGEPPTSYTTRNCSDNAYSIILQLSQMCQTSINV